MFIRLQTLAICVLLAALPGCSLFEDTNSISEAKTDLALPPMQASRETIQVEILFAERPYSDLLVGDILWDTVDESGALDPAQRDLANKNGFRVGIVASDPPQSLQRLLGITTEGGTVEGVRGRRVGLFENTSTEIQTSDHYERCSIELNDQSEQVHVLDFENARCVLRLKARRFQPGWAKLEFQPEIHFGDNQLRHQASDEGWTLNTAQNIKKFHGHQFEVTLNQGEMAVVGDLNSGVENAGQHFFVVGEGQERKRRVLVVRLADMQTAVGRRAE